MFVKTAAWHGLGNVLPEAPTTAEAIVAAGLDWDVELVPLVTADTQAEVTHRATRRATDKKILGVVGPDFEVLQNKEAFGWFDPFIQQKGATLESAGSLREGRRVWILAKLNRDPMWVLPGDQVEKYLMLAHGHDGSLSVHAGFTPIRVVCANTLRMATTDGRSALLRIKHTKNIKDTLEKVQEIIDMADATFEATADQYRILAKRQIDAETLRRYVNIVWKAPKKVASDEQSETPEQVRESIHRQITNLFESGKGVEIPGVRGTWWGAYNAVTEYIRHERGSDANRRIDSALFGQGALLNQRALDKALEMATNG